MDTNFTPALPGNPTSKQQPLPLLFAPSELLACGLRAAHTYPLVGTRTPQSGVRSWRMAASPETWAWPLVEWSRTGNTYAALGFDCDSRDAVERAAAYCMGGGDLPTPNVVATTDGERPRASLLSCSTVRFTEATHARAQTPSTYLGRRGGVLPGHARRG